MTRELNEKSAAKLLKQEFAQRGVTLRHTEALDIVARMKGFEAWSHLAQAKNVKQAPEAPKAAPASRELATVLVDYYGAWGNHPKYPREDWHYQTSNNDTSSGYWDWVAGEVAVHEEGFECLAFTVPSIGVTLPSGTRSTWAIEQNLTDRWGELNDHALHEKSGGALLTLDTPLLERLQAQMWDECTFIVRKDNQFGVLFEVEYISRQSEALHDSAAPEYLPHEEVKRKLLSALASLEATWPGVAFAYPDESQVLNERPAVWAFVSADTPLSAEASKTLGNALLNLL